MEQTKDCEAVLQQPDIVQSCLKALRLCEQTAHGQQRFV